MTESTVREHFEIALLALVDTIRQDRSILAGILCGSLSHDTVWSKSDIDLGLVTIDDKKVVSDSLSLDAGGVNVHAFLLPRSEFRKLAEGAIRNSFMHSLLAKGRLLYTHDETIAGLLDGLATIGERDTQVQLLRAATSALPPIYKAHKWWITRRDVHYTALWLVYAATPLAQIEVFGARQLADREVIPQAMTLNPGFFKLIYTDLLGAAAGRTAAARVEAALDAVDEYVSRRAPTLFAPIVDYLRDAGEARSCTEIDHHFQRHLAVEGVTTACEYLADQGLITRVATAAQLTRRSNIDVQELAFVSATAR